MMHSDTVILIDGALWTIHDSGNREALTPAQKDALELLIKLSCFTGKNFSATFLAKEMGLKNKLSFLSRLEHLRVKGWVTAIQLVNN
jgi:hypothetical protein